MITYSINLPLGKRLKVSLAKRRNTASESPILPKLEEIRGIRKGSKVSRFFRFVFENARIKKFFGRNIAFAVIASSLLPTTNALASNSAGLGVAITQPPIVLPSNQEIHNPLVVMKLTQPFRFYHPGVDLDGETGDSVYPIMTGKVENIEHSKFGYGNAIYVDHGNGLVSLYAHLSKIEVALGEEVTPSHEIGKMGSTGHSTGSHLHLEIRQNNIPTNPLAILPH